MIPCGSVHGSNLSYGLIALFAVVFILNSLCFAFQVQHAARKPRCAFQDPTSRILKLPSSDSFASLKCDVQVGDKLLPQEITKNICDMTLLGHKGILLFR